MSLTRSLTFGVIFTAIFGAAVWVSVPYILDLPFALAIVCFGFIHLAPAVVLAALALNITED